MHFLWSGVVYAGNGVVYAWNGLYENSTHAASLSAIGTLLAVVVALYISVWLKRIQAPKLTLNLSNNKRPHQSRLATDGGPWYLYWFVCVTNKVGKTEAKKTRVTLDAVWDDCDHGEVHRRDIPFPIPLMWCMRGDEQRQTVVDSDYCNFGVLECLGLHKDGSICEGLSKDRTSCMGHRGDGSMCEGSTGQFRVETFWKEMPGAVQSLLVLSEKDTHLWVRLKASSVGTVRLKKDFIVKITFLGGFTLDPKKAEKVVRVEQVSDPKELASLERNTVAVLKPTQLQHDAMGSSVIMFDEVRAKKFILVDNEGNDIRVVI